MLEIAPSIVPLRYDSFLAQLYARENPGACRKMGNFCHLTGEDEPWESIRWLSTYLSNGRKPDEQQLSSQPLLSSPNSLQSSLEMKRDEHN